MKSSKSTKNLKLAAPAVEPAKQWTREERVLAMLERAREEDAAEKWARIEIAGWSIAEKRVVYALLREEREEAERETRADFL